MDDTTYAKAKLKFEHLAIDNNLIGEFDKFIAELYRRSQITLNGVVDRLQTDIRFKERDLEVERRVGKAIQEYLTAKVVDLEVRLRTKEIEQ
jgi:hypothetical protein